MAANMAAVRSITLIRFIVILEGQFWCIFQGTVLLIMAFVRAARQGGTSTRRVGCQSNDALFLCCCTLRQHL